MSQHRTPNYYRWSPDSFTSGMLAQRLELPLTTARFLLLAWIGAGKVSKTSGRDRYRITAYRKVSAA
jgi:DNA-binding IclR family transcriptional regulator